MDKGAQVGQDLLLGLVFGWVILRPALGVEASSMQDGQGIDIVSLAQPKLKRIGIRAILSRRVSASDENGCRRGEYPFSCRTVPVEAEENELDDADLRRP